VSRRVITGIGLVSAVVLLVVVVGEWLGILDAVSERIPWWVGLTAVVAGGLPVYVSVVRAALRGKVISHSLMTLGVVAALVIGEWITAAIVVLFMRLGDYSERVTTERSRDAVRGLEQLAPDTAVRVGTAGESLETTHEELAHEEVVAVAELAVGDTVLVRPGERVPVDGVVVRGAGSIDQSTLTGESVPVDVSEGSNVWAATLITTGSIRVAVQATGTASTYGRVVRLAEEAEANRGEVQRWADRFSTIYLPIVAVIAAVTYIVGRDPLATAAVLVVACSCSFALATPIAMMASIGAAARQGLLVKGGVHLETLPHATVLLIDKTGTVTTGEMRLVGVVAEAIGEAELLRYAAAAERDSQHPVARAIVNAALDRGITVPEARDFASWHGRGVTATVDGHAISVHKARVATQSGATQGDGAPGAATVLELTVDDRRVGALLLADTVRPGVAAALERVRATGISRIELLTGDNEAVAADIAAQLGIDFQANLLPEDKIRLVTEYQARGEVVVMVGDGVNDAPALVQADVGIAMGAIGSDVAIEAAHVCLLREDWALVPELLAMARRTMQVVRTNLVLTALYNLVGLSLAAVGILPPIFAAAAQSIPDLGILANSSRLLRQRIGAD
jgi:Cd2+/Zn2+-exporting ATPase/Cu+-exporting ATPase